MYLGLDVDLVRPAFLDVLLAFRGVLEILDVLAYLVSNLVGMVVHVLGMVYQIFYYDIVASYSTGTCSIRMDYSCLDMIAGCMAILVGASLGRIHDMDCV